MVSPRYLLLTLSILLLSHRQYNFHHARRQAQPHIPLLACRAIILSLHGSEVSFWTSTVMFRICKVHVPNLHARVKHGEVENKKGRVVRILQVDRHFYSPH